MLKLLQGFNILLVLVFATYGTTQKTYSELKEYLSERPRYGGVLGKYLNYPGLSYEPNVPSKEGLIHSIYGRESAYKVYVDRMDSVLSSYGRMEQSTENMIDCDMYNEYRPQEDWDKNCVFRLDDLGSACSKNTSYGYDEGRPCITLSLERILKWLPEPFTNETVPGKIRDQWSMYSITVHCEGEDPVSKDNIGDIEYYPKQGFHFKYFPNVGKPGWKNPLLAVQLVNPIPGLVVRVTCTAYAKNLMHYDKLNTGKVSFDVMVD